MRHPFALSLSKGEQATFTGSCFDRLSTNGYIMGLFEYLSNYKILKKNG